MQLDLDKILNNTVENKKVDMIIDFLCNNDTIFISGKSSVGKTVLVAQVISRKIKESCLYSWIDLQNSDLDLNAEFIQKLLLSRT